eukprot:12107480-Karenia_brevis.AAC.1
MLRTILGMKRRVSEDATGQRASESYLEWMIRSTEYVKDATVDNNIPDLVEEAFRRKFCWAGHVGRRKDGRCTAR